jgi:hypothetical protein
MEPISQPAGGHNPAAEANPEKVSSEQKTSVVFFLAVFFFFVYTILPHPAHTFFVLTLYHANVICTVF